MKRLSLLLLLICFISFGQNDCAPCEIISNPDMEPTIVKKKWDNLQNKELIKINSLTSIQYENDDIYWPFVGNPWWLENGSDPWTKEAVWGEDYVKPDLNFSSCVNDNLRWKCGYSYVLRFPKNFDTNTKYPLIVFLHGGIYSNGDSLSRLVNLINEFHMSDDDEYIIVAPIKLGVDWSAKKTQDVILDVKSHLNIIESRIYLTGLSMGGRGTFIIASQLPDTFAAIMPLSPHHQPYSYIPLSDKISYLPTFLHHSKNDRTSNFSMAESMYEKLSENNKNVIFDIGSSGHSGWSEIYSNKDKMTWLLSWEKQ